MHKGIWDKSASGSHEVRGRTLGIVGYGNIGSQLSVLAEALGMSVVFYDTADKLALGNARRCASLERAPRAGRRRHPARRWKAWKQWVFRRRRVRPDASRKPFPEPVARLRGRPSGAARADREPASSPARPSTSSPRSHPRAARNSSPQLRGLENVILTPHVGGSTEEAQQDIGQFVAGKLRDYLDTGATTLSVNLPPVALPPTDRGQRLLFLHRNIPGVLATVDGLMAEHSINIVGQLLATAGDYGYVVTDVSGPLPDAACEQLRALPVAVRLRLL